MDRHQVTKKVTLVGAIINLILAVVKIVVGSLGHSQALVADGIHSLSDLITDAFVWYGSKYANQAPDDEHPYGHHRFETMATLGLAVILAITAVGIVWQAMRTITHSQPYEYSVLIITIAVISIISKEFLYRYTLIKGKQINSDLLKANAWHHRSDAISSVIVLIGISGALFDFYYLDNIAAVIVGVMILFIAYKIGNQAVSELVDTGLDSQTITQLKKHILAVDGVKSMHLFRTRKHGQQVIADIHIQVPPQISVSEGHYITLNVEKIINQHVDNIADIVIHIDPEDDEQHTPCAHLPNRKMVIKDINQMLSETQKDAVQSITLHYLRGKINIDFYLTIALLKTNDSQNIEKQFQTALQGIAYLENINIYFASSKAKV